MEDGGRLQVNPTKSDQIQVKIKMWRVTGDEWRDGPGAGARGDTGSTVQLKGVARRIDCTV